MPTDLRNLFWICRECADATPHQGEWAEYTVGGPHPFQKKCEACGFIRTERKLMLALDRDTFIKVLSRKA